MLFRNYLKLLSDNCPYQEHTLSWGAPEYSRRVVQSEVTGSVDRWQLGVLATRSGGAGYKIGWNYDFVWV